MKKLPLFLLALLALNLLVACGILEEETAVQPTNDTYLADDYAYDEEMEPEDCFPGEEYDAQDKICYIECDTEAECLEKEEEIYRNLDEYLDTSFSGHPGKSPSQPPVYSGESASDEEDQEQPIARYSVDGDLNISLLEKDDSITNPDHTDPNWHQEIWDAIRYLLPNDILKEEVRRFLIFTDGPDGTLAYVEQLPDDPEKWQFAVDIEDARNMFSKEFVHTIIHEFGHIVTLRNNQVPPDLTRPSPPDDQEQDEPSTVELSCRTFYTGEGCANPGSYINLFVERFWDDIFNEHVSGANAAETQEEYDDFVTRFYDKYPDRFVSEYAATNPGEDIAESFAFFVLQEKPTGDSIAEQKVLFFYEFEPLIQMRTHMRGQLARLDKN